MACPKCATDYYYRIVVGRIAPRPLALSFFLMRFLGQTVTRLNEIRRDENAMGSVGQITDPAKR